ncbi:MAG TPA: hypothetical protein VFA98_16590 [Thermoanaerobaculia bacterium]|jgi:hypothetical protein|nr:hypothetical protein [Thermoanaerobaculia bacterium]
MMKQNDPDAPWPHTTNCMCRKCCMPQRLPTIEELEGILREEDDLGRRGAAYAALTLTRVLAREWTHLVGKKGGGQETIVLPAGQLCADLSGGRADLEHRLERLAWELR